MTRLNGSTRVLILELRVNAERDTVQLIEQTAKTLDLKVGEHESHEWIRLMHLRHINEEKTNA